MVLAMTALAVAVAAAVLAIAMVVVVIRLSRAPEASPAPAVVPSTASERAPWTLPDVDPFVEFDEPRPHSSLEDER